MDCYRGLFKAAFLRSLWFVGLLFFIADIAYPVSSRLTRLSAVCLFFVLWCGLIGLLWQKRFVRFTLVAMTAAIAFFLMLPARALPNDATLSADYITSLRRYEGVRYYWGGESPRGIDCSGLVRRGLVDGLFWSGVRRLDAGLVRHSLSLWSNDCSAEALGAQHAGLTKHILDTPSINALDHTSIQPGDLAVTSSGGHVMAYLGANTWIEADPYIGRVVSEVAPSSSNGWFQMQMRIVRWSIMQP